MTVTIVVMPTVMAKPPHTGTIYNKGEHGYALPKVGGSS